MQNGFIVILIFKMNQGCKLADKKFLKYIFWLLEKGGEQKIKIEINLRFWNAVKWILFVITSLFYSVSLAYFNLLKYLLGFEKCTIIPEFPQPYVNAYFTRF